MADVTSGYMARGSSNGPTSLPAYLDRIDNSRPLVPHHILSGPPRDHSDDEDVAPSPRGPSSLTSISERSPRPSVAGRRSRGSSGRPSPSSSNERLTGPSPKGSPVVSTSNSRDRSPPAPRAAPTIKGVCSSASVENARYRLNQSPMADHNNEDRHFTIEKGDFKVFGVFDGHDGSRAVEFAVRHMTDFFTLPSWEKVVKDESCEMIATSLWEFFKTTEIDFFKSISHQIDFKQAISACIPKGLTSYQAQLQCPDEVAQLQGLESEITGGCTAVLAVIANKKLYVANVGDSRAILIREKPDRTLYAEQLSVDHSVENEEELSRLEALGLSRENLKRAGRLGMQENTRSFGDYYIKQGYRDVDTLESAREPPGIAVPHMATPIPIDDTFRYLVLFTDGVYKSVEGCFVDKGSIDANKVLTSTIQREDAPGSDPTKLAESVVARIIKIHEDTYRREALKDARSPLAVNCRKRDDTTCIIYKFPPKAAPRTRQPSSAPSSLQQQ